MTDIQTILDQFKVPYDDTGRGKNRTGWINLACPWCGRDPYLGIPIGGRVASCWNCGKHNLAETLQALTGLTPSEVYALIGELPKSDLAKKVKPQGSLELPPGIGPMQNVHKEYLRNRGFDPKKLEKLWGIQGTTFLGGHLAWRLFVPVHQNEEVVSWTTRRLNNQEPRYHDAKPSQSIISIKDCIYGVDYCRLSIIVVEGPTGVWTIGPGCCCLFGMRASHAQIQTISRFPLRVICFDAGRREQAAEARAKALCRQLSVFDGETIRIGLESGSDPPTCDPAEIEEIRTRYLR